MILNGMSEQYIIDILNREFEQHNKRLDAIANQHLYSLFLLNDYVNYFAYCKNMDVEYIKHKLGIYPERSFKAKICSYTLKFNRKSHSSYEGVCANISKNDDHNKCVHGVVYIVKPCEMLKLDCFESFVSGECEHEFVQVKTEDCQKVAVTYVASERSLCPEGKPRHEYLQHMLVGARAHRLPESYIHEIMLKAGMVS